ncbi:unnamed protein product [Trypanosoma congolense IL3000]|uniref:WGS project CAEQ00000000 data, annotated contig 511 n=1 Tax=Trypanosoma congolense (strain IL3000) TaxID=1068625 RepID=F9WGK5_TRYCI|nr:unnamed protein product [Trypanosoma congolense IL3000]
MSSILTPWWPLTVCIMRSWLRNCLPNWTCSSDMPSDHSPNVPMRRSYLMPLWNLNTVMSVERTHVDIPPSIVRGICLHDISSHTQMYVYSLRVSPHTSKRSLTTPQLHECQHRLMRVATLAVESLSRVFVHTFHITRVLLSMTPFTHFCVSTRTLSSQLLP